MHWSVEDKSHVLGCTRMMRAQARCYATNTSVPVCHVHARTLHELAMHSNEARTPRGCATHTSVQCEIMATCQHPALDYGHMAERAPV
jgi:hypothetical protein